MAESCSDLTTEAECWPAQRDRGCWWENGRCEYVVPGSHDLQTTYTCTSQGSPICAGYVQACYEVACGECAECGLMARFPSPPSPPPSRRGMPSPPPSMPPSRRGIPLINFFMVPLGILFIIPLIIWKIRMKKRAAERAAERARQVAMAQSSTAMQPMGQQPVGSMPVTQAYAQPLQPMAVTCPPGLKPGDSLVVTMGGQQVTVQVPEGITPGGTFMVQPPQQVVAVAVATAIPA